MPSKVHIPETSLREQDEIHLIMEYAKGERWGKLTTPIATRFITSHDEANAELDGLDVFSSSIKGIDFLSTYTSYSCICAECLIPFHKFLSDVGCRMEAIQMSIAGILRTY